MVDETAFWQALSCSASDQDVHALAMKVASVIHRSKYSAAERWPAEGLDQSSLIQATRSIARRSASTSTRARSASLGIRSMAAMIRISL
jgi:hypothetical protein